MIRVTVFSLLTESRQCPLSMYDVCYCLTCASGHGIAEDCFGDVCCRLVLSAVMLSILWAICSACAE